MLVAVSIPIFTAQLEKSKEATDLANLRAAYAEGVASYLDDDTYTGGWYDIGTGKVGNSIVVCGKGSTKEGSANNAVTIGGFTYSPTTDYTSSGIKVSVNGDKEVEVAFAAS